MMLLQRMLLQFSHDDDVIENRIFYIFCSDIRTASSSRILLLHAHYCATAHKWTALKSWTERRTAAGKMVQKNVIQSSA